MATLTTPVMGLPYPDGAERVMDGDNAIGALAAAVDLPLGKQALRPGAVAVGPSSAIAAAGKLVLNSLQQAGAATLSGNQLTIGPGFNGLYLVIGSGSSNAGPAGSDARITLRSDVTILGGVNPGIIPGASVRWECSCVAAFPVGATIFLQADAAYTHTVTRLQIVRLGDGFA